METRERKGRSLSEPLIQQTKIMMSMLIMGAQKNVGVLVKVVAHQCPVYNLVNQNMLGHLNGFF